ncbi:MAG: YHYH domain-containing protein [Cellvibrionaceae bacterium]|nr:YHYH domain-containing protein [Cellvibrionaceae bacterium]
MKLLSLTITVLLAAVTSAAFAHSGGLDSSGCHTNRKTGDYHCHRSPASSRPQQLLPSTKAKSNSPSSGAQTVPVLANEGSVPISERQLVVAIQLLLSTLGYSPGKADGSVGPATREAIAKFQRDHKLEPNDKVSGDLLVHLARAVGTQ